MSCFWYHMGALDLDVLRMTEVSEKAEVSDGRKKDKNVTLGP